MDFYWVYNIPTWQFGGLVIAVFVVFSLFGQEIVRRVRSRMLPASSHNDLVSYYLGVAAAFFGITLGLLAVGTYQAYSALDACASREAAMIAGIYRDVSAYPEPVRTELRRTMEEYLNYVIDVAWPMQRQGREPMGDSQRLTAFQNPLFGFEPSTESMKIIHAETIREYHVLLELRRTRLQSIKSGLPSTMYIVVILGAMLNMSMSWLFVAPNYRMHQILSVLMAALLGLLVFLIAAMDNPFRGDVSVGPDAFIAVRDRTVKRIK